jgi:hypothetical protein
LRVPNSNSLLADLVPLDIECSPDCAVVEGFSCFFFCEEVPRYALVPGSASSSSSRRQNTEHRTPQLKKRARFSPEADGQGMAPHGLSRETDIPTENTQKTATQPTLTTRLLLLHLLSSVSQTREQGGGNTSTLALERGEDSKSKQSPGGKRDSTYVRQWDSCRERRVRRETVRTTYQTCYPAGVNRRAQSRTKPEAQLGCGLSLFSGAGLSSRLVGLFY